MLTAIETREGVKLRRVEKPKVASMPEAGSTPPLPGAVYDSVSGVWRLGAFIVPTRDTSANVPYCAGSSDLSPAQHRIRVMSQMVEPADVLAAVRRQNKGLRLNDEDRLELALAMTLLDKGITP